MAAATNLDIMAADSRTIEEQNVTKTLKTGLLIAVSVLLIASTLVIGARYQLKRWYLAEDPIIWLPEIWAFEASDRKQGYPENAVVFVGSSSIRFWETLAEDMAPIPVIRRGFGGSRLADATYYADRIVTRYKPSAVVLFSGTNDMVPGRTKQPQDLFMLYRAFVDRIWRDQPDTPIFYIAITPSPSRWEVWPLAREANRLISEFAANESMLYFIDTQQALLGVDGMPRPEMYRPDGLHLSKLGYRQWAEIIRSRLLAWASTTQSISIPTTSGR